MTAYDDWKCNDPDDRPQRKERVERDEQVRDTREDDFIETEYERRVDRS